jgi:YgiT-type zinc finger domain-containing protein
MVCLSCKTGEMHESTNAYFIQLKNCYVIIENVPCYKCSQCGEIFYKASVIEKIDELTEQIENVASKVFIMDYTKVA